VVAAVAFARAHGLGVAIRGGGVGWVGAGPGTVLLDLRALDEVVVDRARGTVRVGAGALWRDVHLALAPHGLAAAGPQFPRLSVAGFALGGGHGWLSRKLGWGCDTLRSVDLVTADGRLVHVDAGEHADLFWALRGAGHNFGVAVALELTAIPLQTVTAGAVWFAPDRTAEVLAFYRDWAPALPDEVSTIVGVSRPHTDAQALAPWADQACAHVLLCHCGTAAQAAHDLSSLRGLRGIVADGISELPYWQLAAGNDVFAPGPHRRSRMRYLRDLTDAVVDTTVTRFADPHPRTMMGTHYYGGAIARVDEHATALSHRHEPWNYMVAMTWTEAREGDALREWQDAYLTDLGPDSVDAAYVNYLCQEPERVAKAYNPRTWQRLRRLKTTWDPDNVFATNQNVPPNER
ncbi:MAG: FAD-binding oxidoreductase, partial [Conexibacter sp.]|nr:FAD-binding oxidoreductase [Conexibacter sp.]